MAPTRSTKASKTSTTSTGRHAQGKENATSATRKAQSAPTAKHMALGNKTNTSQNTSKVRSELEKLKAENASLKHQMQQQALTTPGCHVPRPIKKNGQSVRMIEALGLLNNRDLYNTIRRYVRYSALRAGIEMNGLWRDQDKEKLAIVISSSRKRFRFLAKFSQCWPVEEILKIQLKNHRQYVRRMIKRMEATLGEDAEVMDIDVGNALGQEELGEEEEAVMVDDDEEDEEDGEEGSENEGSGQGSDDEMSVVDDE